MAVSIPALLGVLGSIGTDIGAGAAGLGTAIGTGLGDIGAGAAGLGTAIEGGLSTAATDIGAGAAGLGTAVEGGLGDIGSALGLTGTGATAATAPASLAGAAGAAGGGAGSGIAGGLTGAATDLGTASADLGAAAAGTGTSAPLDILSGTPLDLTGTAGTAGTASNALDLTTLNSTAGAAGASPLNIAPATTNTVGSVAPAATSTASGTTGVGSFLSNVSSGNVLGALSSAGSDLKAVAPVLGLAGLGYNLYSGYEQNQSLKTLAGQEAANAQTAANISSQEQSAAAPLLSSGQTLMSYLTTNTLPPQFQAEVTQNVNAAKAAIIQGYASRGMSTNPQQNSALAQDLSNVDLQAQTLQANLETTLQQAGNNMVTTANSLLQSGLNATELSSELPIQMAQLNSQLNAVMANSISSFAAALNGSGVKSSVQLTLPSNIITPTGGLNLG